ncbi:hypothetical protein VQ042_10445 [Aurantimonas sp. A2-1-M11]|uniref:hypothetical protein n=1 Tax=Aurantimonas sp. A2-1-M11 TaxID=3113712 RepID=UPI002F9573EC
MKDVLPRIYRSLEKDIRRGGFDTIVTAATMSFLTLRTPGDRQLREFGDLVSPAWPSLDSATQRALAEALAHSARLPACVVARIVSAPLDVAAPFLHTSPCLTHADLEALQLRADAPLRAVLAEREATLAVTVGPMADPAPVAAPAALSPAESVRPAPVHQGAAAAARAELFRLARPGRTPAKPAPSAPQPPLARTVAGLVADARAGRSGRFHAALGAMLDLDSKVLEKIADDASGEWLAAALKVLRAGPTDALTAIMLLKPRIGADVAAFETMKTTYRGLDIDACRSRLGLPAARIAVRAPSLQPQSADLVIRPVAGAPRRAFGRRSLPPAVERSIGKR